MSQRFQVRASLAHGQPFYCRAGRGWSSEWTEIEVIDQDADPMLPNKVKGLPEVPDPARLGRKSFAIVNADPRIVVKPLDGTAADAIRLPEVESKVAGLQAQLAEVTAQLEAANLRARVAEEARDTKDAKIAELDALLAEVTKPADKQRGKPPKA